MPPVYERNLATPSTLAVTVLVMGHLFSAAITRIHTRTHGRENTHTHINMRVCRHIYLHKFHIIYRYTYIERETAIKTDNRHTDMQIETDKQRRGGSVE